MSKKLMDKRERRIMQFLWDNEEKALGVPELEELGKGEKLSRPSIFKALQSLLDKGYISVAGKEQIGTVYARQYTPAITREEYAVVMLEDAGVSSSSLGSLALAMIGNERSGKKNAKKDEKLIKELEEIIERIKKGN